MAGFCEQCVTGSTEKSPGNISTVNGIGRKFYGHAEKCATCGSVVRVLWFTLVMVPLIPLGSYRWQQAEGSRFFARRTHIRWPQVFVHWAVGLVLGVVAFSLIAAYESSKHGRH